MQITGEIDWNEQNAAAEAQALDQLVEIGAVRSLTSKLPADKRSPDYTSSSDMYVDLDSALPLNWDSLTGKGQHKLSKSTDSQEFEFSMSGVSVDSLDAVAVDEISPADDLFYKGQLLPLHLPKRLQMVQKLSSKKLDLDEDDSVKVSCLFQTGTLKSGSPGDDSYLGSALVNSRSSSLHSQGSNNFWESDSPGELDSGDSSSSRDSSGSSQDACSVPGKQSLPKFNDHIAFQKEGAIFQKRDYIDCHNLQSPEKPHFSSWLRTPFKWKVFLGLKKPLRTPENFKLEEPTRMTKSSFSTLLSPAHRPPVVPTTMKSSRGTYFSAEMKITRRKEVPQFGEEQRDAHLVLPGMECDATVEHEVSASKTRESLHKYFSMLKLSSVKAVAAAVRVPVETGGQSAAVDTSWKALETRSRSSFSGNLTSAGSPQQQPLSSFWADHIASPPKAAFWKPPLTQNSCPPEAKCAAQQERPRSKSPSPYHLPGNLRVPSFSRGAKVSANASSAVGKAASPHHSGAFHHNCSPMGELHSSIQGAIAHCKQSQLVVG